MFRRPREVACTRKDDHVVVEGASLEAVVREIERRCGPDPSILDAERTIRGGVKGFFGREWFRLVARANDPGPGMVIDGDESAPMDGPSFAAALADALAAYDTVELSSVRPQAPDQPAIDPPAKPPRPRAESAPADAPLPASPFLHQPRPVHLALPELSLEELLSRLDTVESAPPPPSHGVVAVIGQLEVAHQVARNLVRWLPTSNQTAPIVATTASQPTPPEWMAVTTINPIRQRRHQWAARSGPTIVVVNAPGGAFQHPEIGTLLTALEPAQIRCALPAWAGDKSARLALAELALRVDAVDLIGLAHDADPSRFLGLPFPVGSIDGRPASPGLWAAHLLAAFTPLHEASVAHRSEDDGGDMGGRAWVPSGASDSEGTSTPVPAPRSPSDRTRTELDEGFAAHRDIAEVRDDPMRIPSHYLLQEVVQDAQTVQLGRPWDAQSDAECARQYTGSGEQALASTAGPILLDRPRLRTATEHFASTLLGKGVARSEPLEALLISAWVRGLSAQEIDALLVDVCGPDAAGSRSAASSTRQRLLAEFEAFRKRDLTDVELDYLYLGSSKFTQHDGTRAERVLVAHGITSVGRPVLLAVEEPGGDTPREYWGAFLDSLCTRGLRPPLLVISDAAPRWVDAIEAKMPTAMRQRCLIHQARNVLARVPAPRRDEIKAAFWAIFDPPEDAEESEDAVVHAQTRIDGFARHFEHEFPAAVSCLLADRQALTSHLRFPAEHWKRIRHTNLIQRTFGETRQGMTAIGRLPQEASCLSLVWAVLDRASRGWRGLAYTPVNARHLTELRRQLRGSSEPAGNQAAASAKITA